MRYIEFENLLKNAMGLDAASIGSSSVERAVRERLAASAMTDLEAYRDFILTSDAELQELIEAIVVPETWFFRDREAFTAVARYALGEWALAHPQGVLRLLSLPCSTGEEPYSVAMALLDAGFPPERFRVDAVDISARAIAYAQRAVYGRNSFRGNVLDFRARHFSETSLGYRLHESVRERVQFSGGNLFAPDFLPGTAIYDVIFCRNVLIYFDRPTQDRAVEVLDRLLTETGFLFVGPSESGLLLRHAFRSAKLPLAFAFRKAVAVAKESLKAPVAKRAKAPGVSLPAAPRAVLPKPSARPSAARPAEPTRPEATPGNDGAASLDLATRLADQGRLADAATLCEAHLSAHPPSARAYHLLGLVNDARGLHEAACYHYRKAIYLEPDHYEALVHLAALLEKLGDRAGAQVLQARVRRLSHRNQS